MRAAGREGHLWLAGLAGLLVLALARAAWLAWVCDDAFLSLRYAQNLVAGAGLVFNPGEWVEGYTNFLWTFLLGVWGKLGGDIPLAGLFGNLACFVLALIASQAAVRRAAPAAVLVPFAAIALAASRPFYTFASSGLETMPAALCIAVALWASTLKRGAFWAGLAMTVGCLTRPDQVLYQPCAGFVRRSPTMRVLLVPSVMSAMRTRLL